MVLPSCPSTPDSLRKFILSACSSAEFKTPFKSSLSIKQGGFTLVPLSLYFSENVYAKITCGIAKGKKKIYKRESIKQRDWDIKKQRLLKNN